MVQKKEEPTPHMPTYIFVLRNLVNVSVTVPTTGGSSRREELHWLSVQKIQSTMVDKTQWWE